MAPSGINTNDTAGQLPSTLSILLGGGNTNDGSNGLNGVGGAARVSIQPGSAKGVNGASNAANVVNKVSIGSKVPKIVKQKSAEELEGDYNKNSTNMYQDPKHLASDNLNLKDELIAQDMEMENMIMEMATPSGDVDIPHAFAAANDYNDVKFNGGLESEGV